VEDDTMKLTLEYVHIKDMQFGSKTKVENGVLTINKEELRSQILKDPNIKDVKIDICRPEESIRIINIVDAIEPRAKTTNNANWCGVLSGFDETPGTGVTRCLKGASILILDTNHVWPGGRIGNIDMKGPLAELSPYAKLCNLAIHCFKADNGAITCWDFAASIRKACYGAGVYLARASLDMPADSSEVLDNETVHPGLPNIGYYQQVYAAQYQYENVPEPIYYGFVIPDSFPLVIQPQEVIDGAIAWGHGYHQAETYSQQNHPIIMSLMRSHGKELNFRGMMIGTTNTDDHRRRLAAMMIANTMKEVFHCDGVILTKTFGGASHVCEGEAATQCEKRGMAAVPMIQALNEHTMLSNEMLFDDTSLQSIVQSGMYFQRYDVGPMERIVGGTKDSWAYSSHFATVKCKAGDALYAASSMNVLGCLSQIGNSCMQGMDF
jgi:glycine reductase